MNFIEEKTQAKKVIKMITPTSPNRCVLEAGDLVFFYIIEQNVLYLTLADRRYPRRAAFKYLEELAQAFYAEYGNAVLTFTRPYSAVAFDSKLERIRSNYIDPQGATLSRINNNLQDIHNVMVQNIQDVLQRGEKMSRMEGKSQQMLTDSNLMKKYARYTNILAKYRAMLPLVAIAFVVILVLYLRFFK